jgi:hypothetical protein
VFTILAGNYYNATELRSDRGFQGANAVPRCVCDWAYNDGHYGFEPGSSAGALKNKYCREKSIAYLSGAREMGRLCPSWGEHNDVVFLEYWQGIPEAFYADMAARVAKHGGGNGSPVAGVVYHAGGLHTGLGVDSLQRHFRPQDTRLRRMGFRQICASVHAPGRNHDPKYETSQGVVRRRAYNAMIRREACRQV